MTKYIVRETVTLMFYVEAEDEAGAKAAVLERGPSDFDEIDCSPRGAFSELLVELDTEA